MELFCVLSCCPLSIAYYHSGQHPPTTREFKPRPTEMVGLQERTRTPATITVPPVVPFPPTKMVPSPNFSGKEGSGEPDGIIRYSRDFILSLFRPSLQPPETHFVEIEGITTIDSLAPATITWEKAHPIPANLLTEDLVVTPALSRAYAFGEIYNSWEREAQRDHVRKGGKVYGKEIPPGLARHSHPYHRTNAPHGAVNYEGSERPAYDSFGQRQGASESAASQASSSSMNGDVAHAVHTPAPQSAEASSEQTVSGVAAFKDSVNQQDAPKDENGPKQTAPEVYDTEVEAWYYKDSTGEIQGPFSGKRMWDWYQLGYFGKWPHLPVSYRNKDNFTPMSALFSNPATAFLIAPPTPGPREDRQEQAAHVAAKPQSYPHHAGQVQHTSESQYPAQGNPDAMNMRVPNYARDLNMSGAAGPAGPYQDGSMHGASHGVKYPQGGDAASAAHPNPRAQWSNARGFLEKLFADHMQIRREKDNTTHVLTKLQSHYNMVCVRMNEMEESMKNISNQMMHMGPNARASQHMEEIKRQYAESQNERHVVQTEMMFQNKVLSSHMQALDTLGEEIAKIQHQISELEKRHGINEGMGEFPADAYPFNSKGQPMQPMMNMFQHMSVSGPNANEAGAMHGMERSGMNTGMRYPHSGSEMVNRQAPWHPTHPRSN